jgi:hypothetical protein
MGVQQAEKAEIGIDGEYDGDICPECGKAHVPNAVTLAAMQEAEDIMSGRIKVQWNHPPATKEELRDELREILEA